MKNCKVLASIEGTLAHNIIWAHESIIQIILRKQSRVLARQIQLNQAASTNVTFIDVYKEPYRGFPINYDRGPFLLSFNKTMQKFITDAQYNTVQYGNNSIRNFIIYTYRCAYIFVKHTVKNLKNYLK